MNKGSNQILIIKNYFYSPLNVAKIGMGISVLFQIFKIFF
jgi:hypothetical protein